LGVWLVYALGAVLWRPATGFVAALIVATNLRYAWLARVGRIDMPLGLATTLVLVCFWLGYRRMAGVPPFSQPTRAWRWMLPCYLAATVAVMLKGPVGLVLPATAIGLFLVLERHPVWPWNRGFGGLMYRLGVWWGVPLMLLVAGPWFVWATVATDGEFLRTFFLHHHLDRTLGTDGLKPEPIWYYIPRLFIDLFPWSLILPAAITAAVRETFRNTATCSRSAAETPLQSPARFVLAWTAGMFVFLSLVRFKRHDYLLPLVPGLALLIAGYWDRLLVRGVRDAEWRWAQRLGTAIALSVGCVAVAVLALRHPGAVAWLLDMSTVQRLLHDTDRMLIGQLQHALSEFSPWAIAVGTSVVLAGVLALLAIRGRRPVVAVALFATAWTGTFWLSIDQLLPRLEPLREQRSIAQLARELRPPSAPLFYYGREDQQLMFYLGPHTCWLTNREALRGVIDQEGRPVFVVVALDRFLARRKEWPDVKMIPLAQNVDNPLGTHRDPAVLATNAAGWRLVQATRAGAVAGVGN
jgi:4-amino-4-deoxy-L-arabinose transferase-like glycosyltransferase